MTFSNKDESSTLKVIENTTTLRGKSFSPKTETHFCWKLAYLLFPVDFVIRISNSGRLELILCKIHELTPSLPGTQNPAFRSNGNERPINFQ